MQQCREPAGGATEVKPRPHIYDVFINHRGPDVKLTFATRLAEALSGAGFHPFLDAKSIRQGRHVFNSIDEALSGACVHVAIFSKRYAESKYCLGELWNMLQTRNIILPLFYGVNPEHLRRIDSGPFAEGFRKHESRGRHDEIKKWKEALRDISNRRGYRKEEFSGDEDENQLIRSIVVAVHNEMPVTLQPQKRRFGLQEPMKEILGKLYTMGENVGIIGLFGMGGIGKTTLANELYSHFVSRREFQLHSFLKDVRSSAPFTLQRQLVRDLIQEDMESSTKSYQYWFDAFGDHRVFIVVDDIDNTSQFTNLIPNILQLGRGSRILVTSRHRDVLTCTMGPAQHNALHEIKELNHIDSRQLFNWHAFYSELPSEGFHDVAQKVADACGGHPLALEVIGGSLFDKKELDDRYSEVKTMDTVKTLKENGDILDKLRISYITLPTDSDRAMFRDIACLMIGLRVEVALEIWTSCHSCGDDCSTTKGPHLALRRLMDKSLVKLNAGELGMHDLMRDMGRDAVVKEAPLGCPGRRTLLWDPATASKVLKKGQGTDRVRGLKVSTVERKSTAIYESRLFATMDELHLLVLDGCAVVGDDFSTWSQEIRWLQWRLLPHAELPSHLKLPNLVVLDLTDSRQLCRLWQDDALVEFPLLERLILTNCRGLQKLPQNIGQRLPRLRTLLMENCSLIADLPDTAGQMGYLFPLLETLDLTNCRGLEKLPQNVGQRLRRLRTLQMENCSSIAELPDTIGLLKHLENLILSGCENLTTLPDVIINLTKLEKLVLTGCSKLEHLPKELGRLFNLVELHLTSCNELHELPSSMVRLRKLKELHMQSTPVENLPEDFGQLTNLRILCMSHLVNLPPSCEGLVSLAILDLENCKLEGHLPPSFGALTALKTLILQSNNLVAVEALPGSVQHLDMGYCHQLIDLPSLAGLSSLKYLNLCGCRALTHVHGLEFLTALEEINLAECTSMVQSGLHISPNRALRMCYLSGSKVAVRYDNAWSEKEPALQVITYYGSAIGYLPSVSRKIKDNEWSYELLMETTISSNKECVAVIISFAGHDQGSSSFVSDHHPQYSQTMQTSYSAAYLPERIVYREAETRNGNNVCYLEGRVMRGNKEVICSRLFKFKHVDELNQVYLCTLRRHHPLVQSIQIGDQICVHARSARRRWTITVEGALCVVHGENETQEVAINSKLLSGPQSRAFCVNFGALILADNMHSALADFLQDAESESYEIRMEHPTSEDTTRSEHSEDSKEDVQIAERRESSCETFDGQGWILPPEFGHYSWKHSWILPKAGEGLISFIAEGNNDVHVAISTRNEPHDPMYEIVIGGWRNRETGIRREKEGRVLSTIQAGLLYPNDINQLWVSIDKRTYVIQIGRGEPYEGVITKYMDPIFLAEAQYVSFTTWDTPLTYSHVTISDLEHTQMPSMYPLQEKIEQLIQHQKWTIAPSHGTYSWAQYWKLPCIGRGVLSFEAEATNGIHIAISAHPHTIEPMYEIVIGGWNNTRTSIRQSARARIASCVVEVGITSPTSCFWVSIDDRTSVIQIGRGEPGKNIFCLWKDIQFLAKSHYFSFTTFATPITYSNVAIRAILE